MEISNKHIGRISDIVAITNIFFLSFTNIFDVYNFRAGFYISLVYLLFYSFLNIKILAQKMDPSLFLLIFIYSCLVYISTIFGTEYSSLLSGIFRTTLFLLTFSSLVVIINKGDFYCILQVFIFLSIIISIAVSLQIIIKFLRGEILPGNLQIYLIGNKFNVSYFNFKLLLFIELSPFIKENDKKKILVMLSLFFILLSFFIHSSTGIFIFSVFLIDKTFFYGKFKLFSNKYFLSFCFILSGTYIFWFQSIADNKVLYLIFNFLGEDIYSQSGRSNVFLQLPEICFEKPWLGYGYGASFGLLMDLTSTADAQNGLWQLIVDFGFLGSLSFIVIIFYCLFSTKKVTRSGPIYEYFYITILISFFEIGYSNELLFFALFAYFLNNNFLGELSYERSTYHIEHYYSFL
jgi:hypothetical protein